MRHDCCTSPVYVSENKRRLEQGNRQNQFALLKQRFDRPHELSHSYDGDGDKIKEFNNNNNNKNADQARERARDIELIDAAGLSEWAPARPDLKRIKSVPSAGLSHGRRSIVFLLCTAFQISSQWIGLKPAMLGICLVGAFPV